MSCGLAITAALLLTDPNVALSAAQPVLEAGALVFVAGEPMFADIVARAGVLKSQTEAWAASGAHNAAGFFDTAEWSAFQTEATELAALDMQGHIILRDRGADGDLKCILRGISEDMPGRVAAFQGATSAEERAVALAELTHLFDDNVAVITAPPQPEV